MRASSSRRCRCGRRPPPSSACCWHHATAGRTHAPHACCCVAAAACRSFRSTAGTLMSRRSPSTCHTRSTSTGVSSGQQQHVPTGTAAAAAAAVCGGTSAAGACMAAAAWQHHHSCSRPASLFDALRAALHHAPLQQPSSSRCSCGPMMLDVLIKIKDEQDQSLSFRRSCRCAWRCTSRRAVSCAAASSSRQPASGSGQQQRRAGTAC